MSETASAPRHRLRRIVLAGSAVLVVLAAALVIYVYRLLQPQRFTTLLENELAAAGLRLSLQAPAEPTLFPRPGVQLQGFSLTNTGSQTPVLEADGARIVVPWRALLHGDAAIGRVDVTAPRVDLGQLEALLARLPHHAGPPRLPTIMTGVHMNHGTLVHNGTPLLFDFSLATGALAPGRTFRLDASARSAAGRQLSAALTTVPTAAHDGVIDFDSLRIDLAAQAGVALQLAGRGSWRGAGDLALHLQGTLQHHPLAPAPAAPGTRAAPQAGGLPSPGLVLPPAAPAATDRIDLDVAPARGGAPMTVALKLDGDDAHADLRLQPTEFDRWWTQLLATKPGAPATPLPFTGAARVRQLDFGWLKATDLSIDAGPDVGPASATSSARAPAGSSAH